MSFFKKLFGLDKAETPPPSASHLPEFEILSITPSYPVGAQVNFGEWIYFAITYASNVPVQI